MNVKIIVSRLYYGEKSVRPSISYLWGYEDIVGRKGKNIKNEAK